MTRRADIVPIAAGVATAALADARLPDPGQLSTVAIAIAVGGLLGGTAGRLRRLPAEEVTRLTSIGGLIGGWLAALCWLIALVTP